MVTKMGGALSDLSKDDITNLQETLLNTVLDQGIEGLVSFVHEKLRRPVVIETSDFKVLSSIQMKGTPVRLRKNLLSEVTQKMSTNFKQAKPSSDFVQLGERLVVPIVHGGKQLVGFLSVNVNNSDEEMDLSWFLKPAALACMVDLVQRSKTDFGLSTASRSLLRDLMVGQSLSSVDLEKVERHFGFDLFDGFYIFAVDALGKKGERISAVKWPEDKLVTVEAEGSRIYVVPFQNRAKLEWQVVAEDLIARIKALNKAVKIQLGGARVVDTILEFHEGYRQARQALIIGSMINPGAEYAIGYGDLGLMRLLYLIVDHPEMERFYQETLGPLEAYDKEFDTDLTESLKVYVEQGANLNSAARALFVHRHTLRYRLEQIEEDILKIDVDSQEVLLNLQVAYLIKQLRVVG